MELAGANGKPTVGGLEKLPGTANYFIGNDPRQWHTQIPTYSKVRYKDVYPGIDLVYYGNPHQLEYDFRVAPGADPKVIWLSFRTADEMKLDAAGDIVLSEAGRDFRFRRPLVYQEKSSVANTLASRVRGYRQSTIDDRQLVDGRYVLLADNRIGFELGPYDRTRPLIIDPVLSYSTYLGGSDFDQGNTITVDSSGAAYVTGFTSSTDFPTTSGAYQTTNRGDTNVFISKFNASGNALVYSTYLGGNTADQGKGIAVDSFGNAYVAGQTFSSNFPTTAGALQTSYRGNGDAFVSKLSATGSSLLYSTYLGGSGLDEALGIALDSANDIYLTGKTFSTNFPTASPIQLSNAGTQNAFVTELNAAGSLIYSTYLGGNAYDQANAIAVDTLGDAYITGYATSSNFPTANALQAACASCSNSVADAFVAELSANGAGLVYSTYLGGSADDQGMGIAVDGAGNAYVTGSTFSTNFPTTNGALQTSLLGTVGAFVTQISTNGVLLNYSTYLGGSGYTYSTSIAVLNENAYIAGVTNSTNMPLANAVQSQLQGRANAYLCELNSQGSGLVFSTYLGGGGWDEATGIAVDASGNMYISGGTQSTNYPANLAVQANYGGGDSDAFVSKIGVSGSVTISPTSLAFSNQSVGTSSAAQNLILANGMTTSLNISSIAITGANSGDFSQTNNCTSNLKSGANCTISVTFTPTSGGTRTAALAVTDSSSNSPQLASLTGTGTGGSTFPLVSFSLSALSFGSQTVNTTSPSQSVTLTNTGTASLIISSISIAGTNSGDFAQTNNCSSSVAVGANCTINVTFKPTATGTRTAALAVADNASGSPQTVSLTGSGVAGSSGTPPTFVQVQNNIDTSTTAHTSFSVNITTQPGDLLVAFCRESSNGTDNFTVTDSAGQTWTQTASGYQNESSTGPRSGMFYVANSAAVSSVTVNFTTAGGVTKPGIMVYEISGAASSSVADGSVNKASGASVTASTSGALTTSNANDILIFATETGGNETSWTPGTGYSIPNNIVTVGSSGSNIRLAMQYAQVSSAQSNATTTTTYGSTNWNSNIFAAFKGAAGTGGTATVSLSPSSLTFAGLPLGSTSVAQVVALQNGTNSVVTLSRIAITGTNIEDFTETNNCGTTLAAGASCSIDVTFTPTALGARSATLTVTDNASNSPQTATLSGSGTGLPDLSPGSLTFSSQNVGTSSAAQALTFTNWQTTALSITSIAITGSNSGDFAQTNNCGTGLAAGANCTINVTFTPAATGARTASVTVTDNATNSPQTAALSGAGGGPPSLSPISLAFSAQNLGTTSAAQVVTLTNWQTIPLNISSIAVTGANSGDFAQTNNCPASLGVGAQCAVNVTFTPTATGARSATLTVTDDATNSPQTASLSGTGATLPSVSPTSLTFSGQNVGTTSAAQAVTLTNSQSVALSISSIAISGTNNSSFAQTNNCGTSLASGANCTINVTFTPTTTGTLSATLTVTDNATNSPQTASLTGTGTAPVVSFSPTSLTFGSQLVGTPSAAQAVILTNSGTGPLTISGVSITGTNSGDFAQTNNCPLSPSTLAANTSCTINLTFTPTAAGTRTASVSVSDNASGSPQTVGLTGTGSSAAVGLSPTSLTFSGQLVGTTSAAQSVTLTNSQSVALSISSIAISGANTTSFAQTNNCGVSLAANSSCTINVTFTPAATGTLSATLAVTDNATNSPQTASLSGTGTALPSLSPTSLTFGSQNVSTTSAPQTVTLTNSQSTALSITGISITGTNSGDFAQTNNCGTSLAAGSSCSISITFTPTATGTRTGTLTVADNATNSPQTAGLTGTGISFAVSLSPTSLNFSSQQLGTTSSAQAITLANTGTDAVTISSIGIGGTNPGDFAQTNNCPLTPSTLAVGASCTINATFTPTATGTRSATLSVNDNATGSPQTASLSGTGTAPAVSLSATNLSFGKVKVGTTSAPKSVTLTNSGTAPLTISGIGITGTNPGDFSQTNNCPLGTTTLAAGSSCTISVTFKPTATGQRSAGLSVSDNASGSPQQVSLKGSGG